jgi:hypothetical protein
MEPSTTYLKYREMIQQGWFYAKELSWISALFKDFEDIGLITNTENQALFELAKDQKDNDTPVDQ